MGPKQSSPVADGRTRAYSSSDVPSGTNRGGGFRYTNGPDGPEIRYTNENHPTSYQAGLNIPNNRRQGSLLFGSSLDDTDGESGLSGGRHRLLIGSLPAHLSPHMLGGFHCPVCSKFVSSDEMEVHLIMCLTKPRLSYNGETKNRMSWLRILGSVLFVSMSWSRVTLSLDCPVSVSTTKGA
ncbi:E3 ubiquitin-protein ligase znrf2-like isoform X2 [Osmerus mordax]|uniref:E3 ubiquitin-protein ligase znrf2-like isoform X2 n=1 Tax=Osmerus mordax TaxID=8014 RepID=UPI0035100084